MIKLKRVFKDYEDTGALHAYVGIQEVVDESSFLTKDGRLFRMLRVGGIDDECLDPQQIDQIAYRLEAALRLLDENFRLYQYLIKTHAKPIQYAKSELPVVQEALASRATYLNSKKLHQIELYWAIVYEGGRFGRNGNDLASFLQQPARKLQTLFSKERTLENLERELGRSRQVLAERVASFVVQLQDVAPLRLLDKQEAYLVLRRLLNFAPHKAEGPALGYDQFVDYQACDSTLECHRDYLQLDDYYIKVLTLKEPPPHTSAHLFRGIESLPGNVIVVNEWKREADGLVRSTIRSRKRHFHNSKASFLNYLSQEAPKPGEVLIDEGAAAMVRDLGEAQQELEVSGHHFGQFSTTIVVYGQDLEEARQTSAECYKIFAAKGAHLTEETFNLLNAFFSILPGNSAFNLRRLWLSSANAADLSLVFAPYPGEPRNPFLGAESLATLETRQGTPYFLNLHHEDVGHTIVLGATGSGKSFFLCFLLMQLQKYAPFTFIFDLGGSYKSLTSLLGGTYLRIGPEANGVSINPFCLPPTKENRQFLFSFVRVLAESSGYQLNAQDERDLYAQIENLYEIDPGQRRLGTLANILNRPLGDALGKWVGSGQYGKIFDSAADNLTFARFQAFDFEGMEKVPELLEPLLFYVLHRASTAVQDPANATTLKAFFIDEAWRFFRNPVIRRYIEEALKTWRKRNAAMILATQSSDDLLRSEMLATVAETCPTQFFLANPGMDAEAYSQIFHLNGVETDTIRSLIPKKEMLLKRMDFAKVLRLSADAKSYWLYTSDAFDTQRKNEVIGRLGLGQGLEMLSKEKSR
jgi:type IV secretion/conjugal transfer VirB4 family ATPase